MPIYRRLFSFANDLKIHHKVKVVCTRGGEDDLPELDKHYLYFLLSDFIDRVHTIVGAFTPPIIYPSIHPSIHHGRGIDKDRPRGMRPGRIDHRPVRGSRAEEIVVVVEYVADDGFRIVIVVHFVVVVVIVIRVQLRRRLRRCRLLLLVRQIRQGGWSTTTFLTTPGRCLVRGGIHRARRVVRRG